MKVIPHTANAITFGATNKLGTNENLTLTQRHLSELITNTNTNSADLDVLMQKIEILESKMDSLTKTNIVEEVFSPCGNINQPNADLVLTSDGTIAEKPVNVIGRSVTINEVALSNTYSTINAVGEVEIRSMNTCGNLPKKNASPDGYNAQVSINNNDVVEISDCNFAQSSYNGLEIGIKTEICPKMVIINNCEFGKLSNNGVTVFSHGDNATITISNCLFREASNILRISNRENKKVTVNIVNCTFKKITAEDPFYGIVLCEDVYSKDANLEIENNLFAPEKVTVNIINCIGPDGLKIDGGDNPAKYSGTKDSNQIIYIYRAVGKFLTYDKNFYPVVNFK